MNSSIDTEGKVPIYAGGVSVYFNGIAAPILYASRNQINAVVPFELAGASASTVVVLKDGVRLDGPTVVARDVAPAVVTTSEGCVAAINSDGFPNSAAHPAALGSAISVFGEGAGRTTAAVTGAIGTKSACGARFLLASGPESHVHGAASFFSTRGGSLRRRCARLCRRCLSDKCEAARFLYCRTTNITPDNRRRGREWLRARGNKTLTCYRAYLARNDVFVQHRFAARARAGFVSDPVASIIWALCYRIAKAFGRNARWCCAGSLIVVALVMVWAGILTLGSA